MRVPRIIRYAVLALMLSPVAAGAAKGQSLESKVNKAMLGRTVKVTVQEDFHHTPLDSAIVRFTNSVKPNYVYQDTTDATGTVEFSDVYTDVSNDNTNVPEAFKLEQNYPNPFNPSTVIPVTIDHYCDVELSIYNILGQKVKTLYDGRLGWGEHNFTWNGTTDEGMGVAAGPYIAVHPCQSLAPRIVVVAARIQAAMSLVVDIA
jgi:hypothetical protein